MTYLLRLRCRLQTALQSAQTVLSHPDVQKFTERAVEAVLNAGTGNYADAVQDALYAALIPALHLLEAERRTRQPAARSTVPGNPTPPLSVHSSEHGHTDAHPDAWPTRR